MKAQPPLPHAAPRMPPATDASALVEALCASSARKLAVVLGAGASKPFGYPLTRELMFRILQGLRTGEILTERGRRSRRAVDSGRSSSTS